MSERLSSIPEHAGSHLCNIIARNIEKSQLCTPRNVSNPPDLCHAEGLMDGVDRRRRKPVMRPQATVRG